MRPSLLAVSVSLLASALCLAVTGSAQPTAPATETPARPAPAPAVRMPRVISDTGVPYPRGAAGDVTVWLDVTLSATGEVEAVVAEGADEPFTSAAVEAARSWTFLPAEKDGEPVSARIRVSIAFVEPKRDAAVEPTSTIGSSSAEDATASTNDEFAAPRPVESHEVIVHGERVPPSRSATLSRAEVRLIPGTFGDPFRAVEALPGVTPIVSGLPFFFIRGAPPGNVGYFLDGIRVPLLFHVGAGPSVIHPALIERVDLYPGGYPARFGRFAGGIVAGETAADERRLRGEYNVRAFDAGAMVEAPFADGRGSAVVGGRYSYTALLFSLLSPDTELQYWDYQARVGYDLGPNDRIGVFSFGSYDFLGERSATETLTLFGTEFHRVDLRYDHDLGDGGRMRTAVTAGVDRSEVSQGRFVRDRLAATRTELELRLAPAALFRGGADLQVDVYDVELGPTNLSPSARQAASFFPSRTDLKTGVRGDVVLDVTPGFEVTPGVRVDLYGSEGKGAVGVDPRLGLSTAVTDRVKLLAAMGLAHQAPSFVLPVPGFQPGGLRGGLQRAVQESFGVAFDLGDETTLTTTVFQNAFFAMSDPLGAAEPQLLGCPPGAFPTDTLGGDLGGQPTGNGRSCGDRFPPGTLGGDRSGGGGQGADSRGSRRAVELFEVRSQGVSRGLEIFLKRKLTKRLGGFLAYTLSRSTRSYQRRSYVASFDRTHVANLALAYDLGRMWRVGGRTMFYTGLPKAPDPTDPDSTRLPPFFRLDLRVEKRWQLSERVWISGIAEWMNATLSKEAIATRCTLLGCEAQMIGPVTIPSLGVEGGF